MQVKSLAQRHRALATTLAFSLFAAGCNSNSSGGDATNGSNPGGPSGNPPTSATSADLAFCVTETNRYRNSIGLSNLVESAELESFAATGAEVDGRAQTAHKHFTATNGGGIALAENEIPWWPLGTYHTVQEIMRQGLAQMWGEGPSGGHYQNLTGPYTQVGCGVFIDGGQVTVVQDLR